MKVLFLFLMLLTCNVIQAQNFSGEIIYKIEIIPTSDSLNLEKLLEEKKGTSASYVITNGYYKSTYFKNNAPAYSYTYHNETKRMYDDYMGRDYITYRDSRKSDTQYYGSEIYKDSTIKVLGYSCYLVKSSADYGNTKTYYSDKIRVDAESFKEHQVGNWYSKLKNFNGAIMLKSITKYKYYIEVQEAIKITERKVDRREFNLPGKLIAASYTALDQQVKMKDPSKDEIECYRANILKAPDLYSRTKKVTSYISFVLTTEGTIKFVKPYEKDEHGLYQIATDILNNCGLIFIPGKIDGKPVDSEVYFPVEFNL
jgi:hypothetical protein